MAAESRVCDFGWKARDFRLKRTAATGTKLELVDAMKLIAATGKGPAQQVPSIGCSIKFRGK